MNRRSMLAARGLNRRTSAGSIVRVRGSEAGL